jgi:hypothetical protein
MTGLCLLLWYVTFLLCLSGADNDQVATGPPTVFSWFLTQNGLGRDIWKLQFGQITNVLEVGFSCYCNLHHRLMCLSVFLLGRTLLLCRPDVDQNLDPGLLLPHISYSQSAKTDLDDHVRLCSLWHHFLLCHTLPVPTNQ